MTSPPLQTLQAFIARLLARHRDITGHLDEDLSLVYADALLRQALIRPTLDALPPQLVVMGPTQAGKSTVVNLLLGAEAAQSSPLAGFTRHAQGFADAPPDQTLIAAIDALLAGLERRDCNALSDQQLDQYCLTSADDADPVRQSIVIWDTPDFDSVNSRSYRSTVPMLCAMADLIVLVVSKDKYADQSVWETLRLVKQIDKPLIACINKVPPNASAQFSQIVRDKFDAENIAVSEIVTLPYLSHPEFAQQLASREAHSLRATVAAAIGESPVIPSAAALKHYLANHWNHWLQPLKTELTAQQQWAEEVESAITQARRAYEEEYLRNPHYKETLQKAINGLLELMEIPGLAKSLARARQAITWPMRTLGGLLKKQPPSADQPAAPDNETQVLEEAIEHLLLQLQRESGEKTASASDDSRRWRQHLWQTLQAQREALTRQARTAIETHQEQFAPQIQQAAQRLFEHLKEHPTTLNALRATRATADAAAVVVALKTGGIGLNDLVLAPAMLSFTSLLTEGAVGKYMQTVEEQLKQQQLDSVDQTVFAPLRQTLIDLPTHMDDTGLYALPRAAVQEAEQALAALEH